MTNTQKDPNQFETRLAKSLIKMGVDWSSQCRAAVNRPFDEKRDALNSSYTTLVTAFAVVAAAAAFMLVQHLRCGAEQWKNYARFLGLTCCGCLFGKQNRHPARNITLFPARRNRWSMRRVHAHVCQLCVLLRDSLCAQEQRRGQRICKP